MKSPTDLGMNRTGMDMAPRLKEAMRENEGVVAHGSGTREADGLRARYLGDADPVGTVPLPGTLSGVVQSTMKKVQGQRPEVLLDRLGQRLAYERTGTRLYDRFLAKCALRATELPDTFLPRMRVIREEEARHMLLIRDAILELGGDPTAVTPATDVDAVISQGLLQAVADPRTTVIQSLEALLHAELGDNDGWEMLIAVTRSAGREEMAARFEAALAQEAHHLADVRSWLRKLVLLDAERGIGKDASRAA